MNIIVGATGQVGSAIVKALRKKNLPVRAVVRNNKAQFESGVDVKIANLFSAEDLIDAFEGGTSVFLITPENPGSNDIIGETRQIIENYKIAIRKTRIRKIVGLSSIGAQVKGNTGNLVMSGILEQAFEDINAGKIFIRPSYYYSNWLGYLETIEKFEVLPTFFPADLKLHMNSPLDVAEIVAEHLTHATPAKDRNILELVGPQQYSSKEVAAAFSQLLDKKVAVQPIPEEKWQDTLISAGFTANTSLNLAEMTATVIKGLAVPEYEEKAIRLPTSLDDYLARQLRAR